MPTFEEIDESTEAEVHGSNRTPFEEWVDSRLHAGAAAVDLVHEIGGHDHLGTAISEADARRGLRAFATHPQSATNACELVRTICIKRKVMPPFPFATWLQERKACGATVVQVKKLLGLKASTCVDETVTVIEEFLSENKEQVALHHGLQGHVERYDDEGDALIAFNGIAKSQWVFQKDFHKLHFVEDESRWEGLQKLANEENAWDILRSMLPLPTFVEKPPRQNTVQLEGVEAVAKCIARSQRVLVLAGAGISVACGLPTFRDDDLRPAIAREFGLANADDVSHIETFRQDPRPWLKWIKELVPSAERPRQPSLTHRFIRLLEQRGQLLRMYTQNIDTIERIAGITNLVECHGTFATATCMHCGERVLDTTVMNKAIMAGQIPSCGACHEGVLKPDVVMFGEPMPPSVMSGLEEDTDAADLLLVLGTSLKVTPCSLVPSLVGASGSSPRILINIEKVGRDSDFECFLPGSCDDVIGELVHHLGWMQEPEAVN